MRELPDTNQDEARRWLGQAVEDLAAAHVLLGDEIPVVLASDLDEDDLVLLEPWVIDGRYPGNAPDVAPEQANRCVAAAERTVETVTGYVAGR